MKTKNLILTALFAALTAIGGFIKIATPISAFTLQNFFAAMAGILLGPQLGALSQLIYVALGLIGLPVFTAGGGISYVFQPTFGFLIGLIAQAYVTGRLSRGNTGFLVLAFSCIFGFLALYAVGLPYMHFILAVYLDKPWTLWQTIWGGMLLFLPWDALKIIAACLMGKKIIPRLQRESRIAE